MYLEFKDVSFSYDNVKALHKVKFGIARGHITGLIGSNGAGKTTTILNITRNLVPSRGIITIDDIDIKGIKNEVYPISYIPDEPVYYEELTFLEHLRFVKALYPSNTVKIMDLIERFDVEEHLYKTPGTLSKGTTQKLMICMSLLRDYDILIADEPFNGLDPIQINEFKNILLECKKRDKAVLISTHLLDMVEGLCDRYVMMHNGNVIASGTKEEICKSYGVDYKCSLEEVYLEIMG